MTLLYIVMACIAFALLIYGLGRLVTPFVGIELIDLIWVGLGPT